MTPAKVLAVCTLASASILSVFLTGCTLSTTAAPDPVHGAHIAGVAFGGQQPIPGSKVYLLAANPAGYGSASLSLLTTAGTGNSVDTIGSYVTTAASTGQFGVSGDYSCNKGYALGATTSSGGTTLTGSEQVYLYILGGNPTQTGTGNNSSIGLLAALGPCNAPYATTGLVVNEVTTAAAAYALAGYAADATHVSSSGTALALTGLSNAGLNSANLASLTTGLPVANSTGITRPVSTVYTIANMLAACVNTSGSNGGCSTLFEYTESGGATGTAATDTATAAINLAHNPYPTSAGVTALYSLATPPNPPFAGGLSSQPNDFTLSLTYTGGGVTNPYQLAIDASGNAWTANRSTSTVSELSSTGTPISTSSGFTGGGLSTPDYLAIDASGNVWVTNGSSTAPSVSKFNSSGQAVSTSSGYTGGGLAGPRGIGIDASGNVWVSNPATNVLSKLNSSGNPVSSTGYTGGGLNAPYGIAIDFSGNVWTGNYTSTGSFSKFGSTGTPANSTGYTGGGLYYPSWVAIDASGNVWTANESQSPPGNSPNSISKFSSTGTPANSSGYTGGGLASPVAVAIDGAGKVWVVNANYGSLSVFTGTGTAISPSSGYGSTNFNYSLGFALDGSGDAWVANYSANAVTEYIGVATPVVTPIVASLLSPYTTPASKP